MKILLVLFLLCGSFGFSQNQRTAILVIDFSKKNNQFQQKTIFQPLHYSSTYYKPQKTFQFLNATGSYTEQYTLINNTFCRNDVLGQSYFLEIKKDAFNPSGTNNFSAALGIGLLNLLFTKN
jgi:regulatory protein YycH of two-component signal transduction system YycFG